MTRENDGTGGQGCRILVADDEKAIAALYAMILSAELPECRVDCAANGAEAIALFRERRHSVVVLDLHMPILDGQRTFREIENFCREYGQPMPSVVF
ncbi:MAG: response regulator, partial [Kiritimatiellae bacterium]|nr:response regulator [Kiritimatiellia bacterium]